MTFFQNLTVSWGLSLRHVLIKIPQSYSTTAAYKPFVYRSVCGRWFLGSQTATFISTQPLFAGFTSYEISVVALCKPSGVLCTLNGGLHEAITLISSLIFQPLSAGCASYEISAAALCQPPLRVQNALRVVLLLPLRAQRGWSNAECGYRWRDVIILALNWICDDTELCRSELFIEWDIFRRGCPKQATRADLC